MDTKANILAGEYKSMIDEHFGKVLKFHLSVMDTSMKEEQKRLENTLGHSLVLNLELFNNK